MASELSVRWSQEAVSSLEQILNYLTENWTEKEVNAFKLKLSNYIQVIAVFPKLFPSSRTNPNLRKAVISQQTSVVYKIEEQTIYIVDLVDNRKSTD